VDALISLIEWEGGPLAVQLPRTPGRKDSEYTHLLCGPVDVEAHAVRALAEKSALAPERPDVFDMAQRISKLEAEVAELKEKMAEFRSSR
jgi:uncharacterized protein YceH (UPF0502 family)